MGTSDLFVHPIIRAIAVYTAATCRSQLEGRDCFRPTRTSLHQVQSLVVPARPIVTHLYLTNQSLSCTESKNSRQAEDRRGGFLYVRHVYLHINDFLILLRSVTQTASSKTNHAGEADRLVGSISLIDQTGCPFTAAVISIGREVM